VRVRPLLLPVVAAVLAATVAGCGSDVNSTGNSGYVPGSGITILQAGQRTKPGNVSGTTLDGKPISLADYAGKVVVINVWGSWCGPCRAEAADLEVAARTLAAKGVVMLGINTRDDGAATALAFERTHGVTYPSIFDPGGRTLLAFHGTLNPSAIPTTVIIDAQGRVAARILGPVPSAQTVVDLVDQVTKESGSAS
jgi:thiol-disulfide isomerase/thioredoxin